jgi:hypothetical protein
MAAAVALGWCRLWGRGSGAGELAAPAGAGCLAAFGAPGVVVLAGLAGGQDPLVAHDCHAGQPEHERGDAGEADPAAVDAAGRGVFDGGVESFGGAAPPVGPSPRSGW